MRILRLFLTALTLCLLLLSLTTIFKATHVWIWMVSILATEYGHWLGLLAFLLIGVCVGIRSLGPARWIQAGLLFTCLCLFFRPFVQAKFLEDHWTSDLKRTLGNGPDHLVSFFSLWRYSEKETLPQSVVYSQVGAEELRFDFFRVESSTPVPWILLVHGGGWDGGKSSEFADFNSRLARNGFAVASISYRLAPKWIWPAQRDDAFVAVAYIKEHARELGIDPDRWVIMGRSAGGQIAEMVAVQKPDSTLKGLIAFYAPADMNFAFQFAADKDIINSKSLLINFLGGNPTEKAVAYGDASPINFVSSKMPPALLMHGVPDPLTWVLQSRRFFDRMKKENVRAVYIELPWATHAFDYNLNGPGGQIATSAVEAFLTGVFKISNSKDGGNI